MEKVFTTTQALRLFKPTTVKGDEDCLSLQLTNATQIEENEGKLRPCSRRMRNYINETTGLVLFYLA